MRCGVGADVCGRCECRRYGNVAVGHCETVHAVFCHKHFAVQFNVGKRVTECGLYRKSNDFVLDCNSLVGGHFATFNCGNRHFVLTGCRLLFKHERCCNFNVCGRHFECCLAIGYGECGAVHLDFGHLVTGVRRHGNGDFRTCRCGFRVGCDFTVVGCLDSDCVRCVVRCRVVTSDQSHKDSDQHQSKRNDTNLSFHVVFSSCILFILCIANHAMQFFCNEMRIFYFSAM